MREIKRESGGDTTGLDLEGVNRAGTSAYADDLVPVAPLKTYLEVRIEESSDTMEIRNFENRSGKYYRNVSIL